MKDDETPALHVVDGEDLRFFEPRLIKAIDAFTNAFGTSPSRVDAVVTIVESFLTSIGVMPIAERPKGPEGFN